MRIRLFGFAAARPRPETSLSRLPSGAPASYRLLISVQRGLHRGAAFVAKPSESVLLGQSPSCDLVLMDAGVRDQSLRLFELNGRLAAEVIAPDVRFGNEALPPGVKTFDAPRAELRVGGASIKIELLRRSKRSRVTAASNEEQALRPVPGRGRWATLTFAGLSMALALGLVGGAVSASFNRSSQHKARSLGDVIEPFNARGAEVVLVTEGDAAPVLRGLVADSRMRDELERDIHAAGLSARLQLRDVRQMSESLTRLARLSGYDCEAHHLTGGRFECHAGVMSLPAVARLQALADQVPGVAALEVRARQPQPRREAVAVAPPAPELPKVEPPAVVRAQLPVIRHVAIGARDRVAFDAAGRTLRVGDVVEGATVLQVRFEAVDLMLDGRRYSVSVTPALTSAASPASS